MRNPPGVTRAKNGLLVSTMYPINRMSRPYQLPPWSQDALRELIDLLNCLNNGYYENPGDLADTLERVSESVRHILDPTEFNDQLPELLRAVAVLYVALQNSAVEHSLAAGHAECQPDVVNRWLESAIATVNSTPGDQHRDLIVGTLHRLRQLSEPVNLAALELTTLTSEHYPNPAELHQRLREMKLAEESRCILEDLNEY